MKKQNIIFDDKSKQSAFINKEKDERHIIDLACQINSQATTFTPMMEWRLDYFEYAQQMNRVLDLISKIRENFPNLPIMITFRSYENGGNCELGSEDAYLNLIKVLIDLQLGDAVDIELNHTKDRVDDLIKSAHSQNLKVRLSNFD